MVKVALMLAIHGDSKHCCPSATLVLGHGEMFVSSSSLNGCLLKHPLASHLNKLGEPTVLAP